MEIYPGRLGSQGAVGGLAPVGDYRGTDAVGVDAAYGDLVDQGHENVRFIAVHEERLAWTSKRGRQVLQERAPGEPGP